MLWIYQRSKAYPGTGRLNQGIIIPLGPCANCWQISNTKNMKQFEVLDFPSQLHNTMYHTCNAMIDLYPFLF